MSSSPLPISPGLNGLLNQAALAPLDDVAWLRVTGEDRVRWLNGMATNSIQALRPGEGCYNFFLNAQGRIQAAASAFLLEDAILLETAASGRDALMSLLDHFIVMDDVELAAYPPMGFGLLVAGPQAPALLTLAGFTLPPEGLHLGTRQNTGDVLIRAHGPLVPRFEVWAGSAEDLRGLAASLEAAGAANASPEDLEHLRLLEGTPLLGTDIRDKDLPQETGLTRALHFAKGCYLGQEIVERIRSRGQVHRSLQGFRLEGELPGAGTPLHAPNMERAVGEITSAAMIPLASGEVSLALGYIRHEALAQAAHAPISYAGGKAFPIALPYERAASS